VRLDIRYRMHFQYSQPVRESQNEVRVRPRDDERQRVRASRLTTDPAVRLLQAFDYWGTAVDHVGVRMPHTSLEVVAETSVDTTPQPEPASDAPVEALSEVAFRLAHSEFLDQSEHVRWRTGDGVAERAAGAAQGAGSVSELLAAVVAEVRQALRYEPETTDIGVSLEGLLAGGVGVCQDFTHLAIGMLRTVGVPARYVSGYLFAADETAADEGTADVVSVQTHAWIEAAVPGGGWRALDPTNGGEVGERHVVIGCGRDYSDVPPVRGAFMGSALATVDAEVVIGRRPSDEFLEPPTHHARPRLLATDTPTNRRHQQGQQQQ
jgi:transglutaminase-like putative cysteine protease